MRKGTAYLGALAVTATAVGCASLIGLDPSDQSVGGASSTSTTSTGGASSTSSTSTSSTSSTTPACDGGVECTSSASCNAPTAPCVQAACNGGCCATENAPASTTCSIDGGEAVCDGNGNCVACNIAADCPGGMGCSAHVCVPAACTDGMKDEDETDVDCGGSKCNPCLDGKRCLVAHDCVNKVCTGGDPDGGTEGTCADPTCSDGVQNGNETDKDCGGTVYTEPPGGVGSGFTACPRCPDRKTCVGSSDCANNDCYGGTCISCMDGVKDGNETAVDCGGSCTTKCADLQTCGADGDCANNHCYGGVCISCADGVKNGTETDVDCGGSTCNAQGKTCGWGLGCGTPADCASTFCNSSVCGAQVLYTSPASATPKYLAVDATNAYLAAQSTTTGSAVIKVPLSGAAPVTLTSKQNGAFLYLAIDGTNVYFTDSGPAGAVNAVPIATGSVTPLATSQNGPGPLAVTGDGAYWINNDGSVMAVGLGGGTVTTLAPAGSAYPAYGILVDWSGSYAYYQDAANTGIFRVLTGGTMPAALLIPTTATDCFTLNNSSVFYVDSSAFRSAPLGGGASTKLLTVAFPARLMIVDTANMYWVVGPYGTETIYKAPLSGGTPVVLATGQPSIDALAVDTTYLYWITQGDYSLKKIHK